MPPKLGGGIDHPCLLTNGVQIRVVLWNLSNSKSFIDHSRVPFNQGERHAYSTSISTTFHYIYFTL